MPAYVDLSTLHTPAAGVAPPASWGLQARDNLETLVRPPRCYLSRTGSQAISHNLATAVSWTTTAWDAGYDGAAPHWTLGDPTKLYIRRTGRYQIGYTYWWVYNAGGVTRQEYILLNGAGGAIAPNITPQGAAAVVASVEYPLTSGDYIQLMALQDTGAALGQQTPPTLSVRWLGYV